MSARGSAPRTYLAGICLAAAVTLLPAVAGRAQARNAQEVFARGFGSKAAAMGNGFVSIADDASAVFWNPAGTGWMPRKTITFSLTDTYFDDVNYSSVSYVHPMAGYGAMGFSLTRWNVGGIERRDYRNLILDGAFSDTQMELIASYSSPPVRHITAAFGVKLDTQAMGAERAAGAGLDLGLLYRSSAPSRASGRRLSAGVSVKNLVEPVLELDADRATFPTRAVFSASYGGGRNRYLDRWVMTLDLNAPSAVAGVANFGLEASVEPVSFRAGSTDGRFTAGVGTTWEGLSFDYAYSDEDYGRLHTFSLSLSFGGPARGVALPGAASREKAADKSAATGQP